MSVGRKRVLVGNEFWSERSVGREQVLVRKERWSERSVGKTGKECRRMISGEKL
jgi:hypothetical protein